MKYALALASCVSCSVAFAADDATFKVEGPIAELHAASNTEDSFRVVLEKTPPLCGNVFTSAYLDAAGANFQGMVQLLIAAKAAHAPVTLVSRKDDQGHCKLFYIIVR